MLSGKCFFLWKLCAFRLGVWVGKIANGKTHFVGMSLKSSAITWNSNLQFVIFEVVGDAISIEVLEVWDCTGMDSNYDRWTFWLSTWLWRCVLHINVLCILLSCNHNSWDSRLAECFVFTWDPEGWVFSNLYVFGGAWRLMINQVWCDFRPWGL